LQKYLSENIFLFKEIQLNGQVLQAIFAKAISIAAFNISFQLSAYYKTITLALSDVTGFAFKFRPASRTAFLFMMAHTQKLNLTPPYPLKPSVLKPAVSLYLLLVIFLRSANILSLLLYNEYSAYTSSST
jgi:hypothetical protein